MKEISTVTGKCSTFGGRDDTGVAPNEGLALIPDISVAQSHICCALFNSPFDSNLGLARNLNPEALYCAMRWDYGATSAHALRHAIVRVESPQGLVCWVRPVDWGPAIRTGRVIDLSPGAAAALGVGTDDVVTATLIL